MFLRKKNKTKKSLSFIMNKKIFDAELIPVYKETMGISFYPEKVFQLLIHLPFHIPFPDNFYTSFNDKENMITSLCFRTHSKQKELDPVMGGLKKEINYTVLETTSCFKKGNSTNYMDYWESILDDVLHYVNNISYTYITVRNDHAIPHIGLKQLSKILIGRLITCNDWTTIDHALTLPNIDLIPYNRDTLCEHEFLEMLHINQLRVSTKNPFVPIFNIAIDARRLSKQGLHRESIIVMQSCIEVLVTTLIKEMLIYEGVPSAKIELILLAGYKNLFEDYLMKKLKISKANVVIAMYWKNLYQLRNDIAHKYKDPKRNEQAKAIDASGHLFNLLTKKIHRSKYNHLKRMFKKRHRNSSK